VSDTKPRILSVNQNKQGWYVESNYDPGFAVTYYFHHRVGAEVELVRLQVEARRDPDEMKYFHEIVPYGGLL
jgi:outer membrane protein W